MLRNVSQLARAHYSERKSKIRLKESCLAAQHKQNRGKIYTLGFVFLNGVFQDDNAFRMMMS